MTVSIFIRTWKNDIQWLNYCLQAIHKNLSGWDEISIVIPENQKEYVKHLNFENIYTCPVYADDYLGQQVSKLQAYKSTKGEYILFVDSDVIFKQGAKVSDYLQVDKPVILKADYSTVGAAICWQKPTEKLFGENIQYEYMRRAPQLFRRDTLINFNQMFPDIGDYVINQPYRQFSEFNVLGYFCDKYENDKYHFIDVNKEQIPENKCKQFWSWGGISETVKKEIENYLN